MDKQAVLSLPGKLLSHYTHTAARTARKLIPQRKQLVFVFGGRTYYWPGMGRELYEKEPVFRNAIHTCEEVFSQFIQNASILPNFEGPLDKAFQSEAAITLTVSALQLGLFEMWKERGIRPHAVMALSQGEPLAGYATGALHLKDALQICAEGALICQWEKKEYLPLFVSARLETFPNNPLIVPIYEIGSQRVLALCHKDQKEAAGKFLEEQGLKWSTPYNETTWPYHTDMMLKHRPGFIELHQDMELMPLQCDFYSCTAGRLIPKNSVLSGEFWFEVSCKPVLMHSTLQAVAQAGPQLMVHIGPASFQKLQFLKSAGPRSMLVEMLDTMRKREPEQQLISATHKQISGARLKKNPSYSDTDFLQRFNPESLLSHADPYPYFDFLRKQGSVHLLPANNTWIVLDYTDIDHVLKNPQVFSSTLHKTFDECLIGADPPHHTLVRSMLQPLFSSQAYAALGEFTTRHAHALLDKLQSRDQFNIVDEFSLPLAQAVVAEFLNIPVERVQACIKGHVYAMEHLGNLYAFFKKYLEENNTGAAAILMNAVKEKKITMEGAVKLMRLLWVAGMTTTSMLLSTAIYFMAKDEALKKQLQENDQLIPKFIDECLRLEAPELDLKRITTTETTLGNKTIPAGSIVMLSLAAANRDPKQFERPGELLLDRPAKQNMSFGGGYHYCLGVGMAKLEAKHALRVILERLPALQLAPGKAPAYFPSPHFRGLATLEVCKNVI
ncbi:MAG TPA: cytochrome P450 [Chitinophagaceae bacterium]|nr:cytochrome P450 [Chitinophagaceae bacterium]